MNLYLRLLIMFFSAGFKAPVDLLAKITTNHRVLPNDLDLLGHMNNGRYLTVADGARVELLIRAGVWKKMKQAKIYPVLAGETIQFRRSLEPFESYQIDTHVIGWDDRFIYIEHKYHRHDTTCALAIVKVRMIGPNKSRYAPVDFIKLVEPGREVAASKNMDLIDQWNESMIEHFALDAK